MSDFHNSSSQKVIKIGIVGLGRAAWKYDLEFPKFRRSHTQSIMSFCDFSLVGGVDSDPNVATMWSNHFRIPSFVDVEMMLNHCKPDLVVLAVPIQFLHHNLMRILNYSPSVLVLVEKPVVSSINEYRLLLKVDHKNMDRVLVNLPRLFAPESLELLSLIGDQSANSIEIIGTYSGSRLNTSLHFVSLIDYLVSGINWISNRSGDFEIKSDDSKKSISGQIVHNSNPSISTFEFTLKRGDLVIDYLAGGDRIVIEKEGKNWDLETSRENYQQNVYGFLSCNGFDNALRISGLVQILPSIAGMMSNYESP